MAWFGSSWRWNNTSICWRDVTQDWFYEACESSSTDLWKWITRRKISNTITKHTEICEQLQLDTGNKQDNVHCECVFLEHSNSFWQRQDRYRCQSVTWPQPKMDSQPTLFEREKFYTQTQLGLSWIGDTFKKLIKIVVMNDKNVPYV